MPLYRDIKHDSKEGSTQESNSVQAQFRQDIRQIQAGFRYDSIRILAGFTTGFGHASRKIPAGLIQDPSRIQTGFGLIHAGFN